MPVLVVAVACAARRENARGEPQSEIADVFDLPKSRVVPRLRNLAGDFDRFFTRDVTERVEAVNTDIGKGTAASELSDLPPLPVGRIILAVHRTDETDLTELALT